MKTCGICGKELHGQQRVFCSRGCRNTFYAKHENLRARQATCLRCGKIFKAYRSNRKYCSQSCNSKVQWERRKARNPKGPQLLQRQWKERRLAVFAEQHGICWLCGKAIDGTYEVHHLNGDHAVDSERVVALHKGCHNYMHGITIHVAVDGSWTFHGRALEYLKAKEA